jgi:VWFA-related protein
MRSVQSLLCSSILLFVFINQAGRTDAQQSDPNASATIRVTSRLVFLDVTVVDRKGHPVLTGLTKDDFTITDDKKPEQIFSFEPPESHTIGSQDDSGKGDSGISARKPPVTIFVLDLLDSSFSDFAYVRYTVRKYLAAQPSQLKSPAELMVLGNQSLEMVQGFTQSKTELMYALFANWPTYTHVSVRSSLNLLRSRP